MLDSRAVATRLGVEPKMLRRFLRSDACSVTPVGSGGRYSFHEGDVDALAEGLTAWLGKQPQKPAKAPKAPTRTVRREVTQADRDAAVWAEEEAELAKRGQALILADIRDPRVRASVKAREAEAAAKLDALLLAAGLHLSQKRDRVTA